MEESDRQRLIDEILRLKEKRSAVILAHNYQRPEIQDLADYTGDSLGLARKATETEAEVIVFCGVRFMAETAAILNPTKTVLLPEPEAGCPLADMIDADDVLGLKREHPGVPVVCYVNSSVEVKAASDVCCTSANAATVIESLDSDEVIFVPDKNLGRYAGAQTGKKVILWPGYCPTHRDITAERIRTLKKEHPGAVFVAHPECEADVLELADHICSTSGMYSYARQVDATTIIVGSESGMLHRLRKENPEKTFILPSAGTICPNMKLTNLRKVLRSLEEMVERVEVDEEVRLKALGAVEKMVSLS